MYPFRRTGRGYIATVEPGERWLLARLVNDTADLVVADVPDRVAGGAESLPGVDLDFHPDAEVVVPTDPAVARLLPDASVDDPELAAEFRRLTQDDLRAGKIAGLRLLASRFVAAPAGFGADDLVVLPGEAAAVAAAFTSVRLVLAERLGLGDDDDAERLAAELSRPLPDDAPREVVQRRALGESYDLMTWFQDSLITLLVRDLPRRRAGAPGQGPEGPRAAP